MIINIKNDELIALNGAESPDFPKYTSQLINWANQNAQGTRPKVVGKLSDLFPEFEEETDDVTISKWKEWYLAKYPDAVNEATEKIWKQVEEISIQEELEVNILDVTMLNKLMKQSNATQT